MRVCAAFSRLLDLPGVWVRKVRFEPRRVVVTVALRRRRLQCPKCPYMTWHRENGVRGLLVQKTGLSACEFGEVRCLERSVFASADRFGEGDVVSAGEGDVLVPEW
ncbi:MAG: hypothetical protein WBP81_04920 [Solirubrobacteraceae bacterium]